MRYFIAGAQRGHADRLTDRLARGLGVFSLALGAAELLLAGPLAQALGLDGQAWILLAYGVREILSGLVLLSLKDTAPGIWLRVLGDLLDGATLAYGYVRDPADRTNILIAVLVVTPIILLDVYCAMRLQRSSRQPLHPLGKAV